ncbi:MAG: hypothetical protein QOI48_4383, partial [Solirubrobacteraceae bacterium]|nr:hypothetical protein [Solirubrobacteraceae bacterium]
YAAAEGGVQYYLFHLAQDNAYWTNCTNVPAPSASEPSPIVQQWNGSGTDTRTGHWRNVTGGTSKYAIELLPANGNSSCDANNAEATMIDTTTGTFRVRATGRALVGGVKRSIVANFKRQSLLDFIYFTDKETRSPLLYDVDRGNVPTHSLSGSGETLTEWAINNCDRYYGNDTDGLRQNQKYHGEEYDSAAGTWSALEEIHCSEIDFIDPDVTLGPFHTNDEFSCSGAPDFGEYGQDLVETSSSGQTAIPAIGFRNPPTSSGATCSPDFIGTQVRNAAKLEIPPTNLSLRRDTAPNNRFVGRTQIKLAGANMIVTGTREDGTQLTNETVPIPADGVVFVSNSKPGVPPGSPGYQCPRYSVTNPYVPVPDNACGNLEVSGNYSVNLTLTAENDIIVTEDLRRPAGNPPSPDVLLGLISNNFIRVYHPVLGCDVMRGCDYTTTTCPNGVGPGDIQIDAAILSLNQSFLADNWFCGAALGNLTVRGAIVQKYRGPVGKTTPPPARGYVKNYTYDRRLRYRSPPKFLDPVQAAWRIQTYSEQVPAR